MARSVQYTTIKNYLSAVKNYHSSHGYELPLIFLRLRVILRSIKRSQSTRTNNFASVEYLFYYLLNV